MAYSYGQLEQLWIQAGGPRAVAPLMAAIALAESGGNPDANNTTDNGGRQTSWGLWQVSNGTHAWPGSQNPNDPLANAKYAVAKYRTQGLSAWGTYDSGAYRQYYKGGVAPSSLPPGGTAGSGSQATDGSGIWTAGNVITAPYEMFSQAIGDVWSGLTGIASGGGALNQIARGLSMFVGLWDRMLHAVEWLFVPSHWVRIISFGFGLLLLIPGLYALMRAGQGSGDISLALGILLTMISGVLFFIAFHNLPQDIGNLQELLGWLSQSVRSGHASSGIGEQAGQVAGSAV